MLSEISLLSAGAVKPGLMKVIDAFQRDDGIRVQPMFATAPEILKRLEVMEAFDVVIAPAAVLDKLDQSGRPAGRERVSLGRVGIGVLVRSGLAEPRIETVEEFKKSLIGAESVVYNRASTGAYLEGLFQSLGVAMAIGHKTVRYADFAAVLNHIRQSTGQEIGLGATTVIIENQSRGVAFAGPLPSEIQNYTSYFAAALGREGNAGRFIRYLASDTAISILRAAGML